MPHDLPTLYETYAKTTIPQRLFLPPTDPVFITQEAAIFRFFRRSKGSCLLCNSPADHYDLSHFYGREVWVLYLMRKNFTAAQQFAQAIQLSGASKVLIICVDRKLIKEKPHARN